MIRVVTDSTADIPDEMAAQLGITVVPMLVNIDGTMREDGISLTREEFYTQLPHYRDLPKTAANSPGVLMDTYRSLNADQIISIHIGRKISGVCNAADVAAADMRGEGLDVRVVDSESLTMGLGWLVITAARMAGQGATADAIVAEIERLRAQTYILAMADTLKYLRKSGRVSAVTAGIGELLQIKLLVNVNNGIIGQFDRVRTRGRGIERLIEEAHKLPGQVQHLSLLYSGGDQQSDIALLRSRLSDLATIEPEQPVLVTPVIGAHVGPAALGVAVVMR
jgi:DegV family protein with EDD domain